MNFKKAYKYLNDGKIIKSESLDVTIGKMMFSGDTMFVKIVDGLPRGIMHEEFIRYHYADDWEIVND